MADYTAPIDERRCQARIPTAGPFALGGPVGDPRDGYRRRCDNVPHWVAVENAPGEDGLIGRMALCDGCRETFEDSPVAGLCRVERLFWHVLPEAQEAYAVAKAQAQLEGTWGDQHIVAEPYNEMVSGMHVSVGRLLLMFGAAKAVPGVPAWTPPPNIASLRRPMWSLRQDFEPLLKVLARR